MASYTLCSNSSSGSDFSGVLDTFSRDSGGFGEFSRGGSAPRSLVLDGVRGELFKADVKVGKKIVSEAKALAALKSHSDAERRRRERINSHLDRLRPLVPRAEKMDKATLLAEVIKQVKELKKNAVEASKGVLVPMDSDEVSVEPYNKKVGDNTLSFRASLCCDYRPELLSDLRQAIKNLKVKTIKAEISTLGSRLVNVFIFTAQHGDHVNEENAGKLVEDSIYHALRSVLEKATASLDYSPTSMLSNKRRRISYLDSWSSSC